MAGNALCEVQNEEVPMNKALDASNTLDEPNQVSKVQPKKKRKNEEKSREVLQKDEKFSGVSGTPLASVQSLKTYKGKVKNRPLDNNKLEEKGDKCSGEASFNCSNVSKKKRSKRGDKTDNSPNTISRHKFPDDCLPQWNWGDSSNAQKTVHEKTTGNPRTASPDLKATSEQVSPSELYKEGHNTSTLNEKICSIDEYFAIHSNGSENKKTSKRKSQTEDVSDLATVQELCKEGHNTLSRNCTSVSVEESSVNLPEKRPKKKFRKDKKKETSLDGKGSDDLSILDPSVEHPDCSSVQGTVTISLNEYHKEEVVPSIGDTINDAGKIVTEIKDNTPNPRASKANSTQETASDSYEAGQNTSTRNCTTLSVDKSTVNLSDKKSESEKGLRNKRRKHASHDAKDSDDLSNLDRSAEQLEFSSIDGTLTKSTSDNHKGGLVSSIEAAKDDAVIPNAETKESIPHPHTSKVKPTQETASDLYEAGHNTLSRNSTIFSVDESPVNLPDKKSESREELGKDMWNMASHNDKDSDVLSNLDHSSEHPEIPHIEGTVIKSLNEYHKGEVVPSLGDLKVDAAMSGTKIKDNIPYPQTSKEKSGHDTMSELHEEGLNALSKNCTVFSADESPANLPDKRYESRKRCRMEEKEDTTHEAIDFDDVSNLDRSAEQPFVEGAVTSSLSEYHKGELVPTFGDVKTDAIMLGTEIKENTLMERSASPERVLIVHTPKKLLVIDLNGLLVDIVSYLPGAYKADTRIAGKALLKRPFCDDFINFCFERFNVGVWSSRTKKNLDDVVDFIMGDLKHKLLFCWHQSQCTKTGFNTVEDENKPMVFKELKKLWDKYEELPWNKGEYNESNTLLLDDSPYKALLNPQHTAIFPYSYEFWDANDNSLGPGGNLRVYLENIAAAEHVQKYVEQNPFGQRAVTSKSPSWPYFFSVINANRFCLPP